MTLATCFTSTRSTPDAPALTCGGRTMSFAELDAKWRAGGWLLGEGLKPGGRIADAVAERLRVVQTTFAAARPA